MKLLPIHHALGLHSEDAAFDHLISTLSDSVRHWDYFVNWEKVIARVSVPAPYIAVLNQLVGTQNFDSDFMSMLEIHPEVVDAIPALLGNDGKQSKQFSVATDPARPIESRKEYDFSTPADTQIKRELALEFVKMTGLVRMFTSIPNLDLRHYLLGVETGLDSNGRKNRGGTAMESATEELIRKLCDKKGWEYTTQASLAKIESIWGLRLPLDSDDKRYDYAIRRGDQIAILETNFYSAGGSKLKSTAEEYSKRQRDLRDSGVMFIWITDGQGWASTHVPLRKAFASIDHVFNLELVGHGALEEALTPTQV